MIAGSAVPCSIQPRPRPSAARARCSPRPAVRASSAAAWKAARLCIELARLAVGLAEAEQQLAAGRLVGGLRELQGLEGAVEMADGLLVGQRGQRPPGRAGRVVDGLGRRSGLGGRDEVVRELAERRFGVAGVLLLEDRADPAVQPHAPGPAQRRVERLANQRVGERVAPRSTGAPPRRSGAPRPPRAPRAAARRAARQGASSTSIENDRPIAAAIVTMRRAAGDSVARRRSIASRTPSGMPELGERGQAPPLGPLDRVRLRSGGAGPPR